MTAPASLAAALTQAEATRVTADIRAAVARTLDAMGDVEHAVARAYEGRAWSAMGYSSWEDYCAAEFSQTRLWATLEERQERTRALHEAGLSVRAIGAVIGVPRATVGRDVMSLSGVPSETADSRRQGRDGREYPTRRVAPVQVIARQVDVLRMRGSGMSQQAVAAELGVSQATVSTDETSMRTLMAEVSPVERGRLEAALTPGGVDVEVVAEVLGVELLAIPDPVEHLVSSARAAARDLGGAARYLHEHVIFGSDLLATDAACLRSVTTASLVDLVGAVGTSVDAVVRLPIGHLEPRAQDQVRERVRRTVASLERWEAVGRS